MNLIRPGLVRGIVVAALILAVTTGVGAQVTAPPRDFKNVVGPSPNPAKELVKEALATAFALGTNNPLGAIAFAEGLVGHDPAPPGLGGTPPYFPFLVRQSDCSVTRFVIDSTGAVVDTNTNYQNILHRSMHVSTQGNRFTAGCQNSTLGVASQIFAVVARPANGNIALAYISTDGVTVIVHSSTGAMLSTTDFPTIVPSSSSAVFGIATADLNGDGNADIVVASQTDATDGSLAVFFGDGTGNFTTGPVLSVPMPVAGSAIGVTIDDLRGVGKLDLIAVTAAPPAGSGITVFLGNGNGTFATPGITGPVGAGGQVAVTGSFNAGAHKDIATSYGQILLGNGDGTFNLAPSTVPSGQQRGIAAADFNGDGKMDLVFSNNAQGTFDVYFGNGDGTFTFSNSYPSVPGGQSVQAVDIDGDGMPDVFVGTAQGGYFWSDIGTASAFTSNLNRGDGTFGKSDSYGPSPFVQTNFGSANPVFDVADFTGDLRPDVLSIDFTAGGPVLSVLKGKGDGTFNRSAVQTSVTGFSAPSAVSAVAAADLDGNGTNDAVFAWTNGTSFFISTALGNGDGTFGTQTDNSAFQLVNPISGNTNGSLALADLNGDHKPEIIFLGESTPNTPATTGLYVMVNNGGGGFGAPQLIDAQPNMGYFAVGDVNGDNIPDIVVSVTGDVGANTAGSALLYIGNGDGTFQTPAVTLTPGVFFPGPVAIADVNGDTKPDIIIAGTHQNVSSGGLVSVLPGNGTGAFGAAKTTAQPLTFPSAILLDNLTGGTTPDLILGGSFLYFATANGDGTFADPSSGNAGEVLANANNSSLKLVDLNGDTVPDLLLVSMTGSLGASIQTLVSSAVNPAPIATTTALQASASTITVGTQVTFTATVTPASGSATPTGTAQFLDGSVIIGSGALNPSAVATFSTTSLAVGSHSITASYEGDNTFDGSVSSAASVQVNAPLVNTTTALTSSVNPSTAGQSVTFTATVTPASGTNVPTGTVNFLDGSTNIGSGTLNGSGVATFATSTLTVATHSITAAYQGDTNFNGSTSPALSQVVNPAPINTTTALSSSLNPSTAGQSITFTATVMPASGTNVPTGTVNFLDGSASIGSGTLNGSGVAMFSTSALAVGTHSITAAYQGDSNFNPSTSAAVSQVVKAAPVSTSTALTSSLNPSALGQAVTLTATVTPVSGNGVPTGTVNFLDGSTNIGSGILNGSGVAHLTTSALTVGTHTITAAYQGDPNFTGSTSVAVSMVVNMGATGTTLTSSLNPSMFGQSVTFTATVTPTVAAGTPTGSVNFFDGGTIIGSGTLNSSGVATLTTTSLAIGTHSISASYPGDANFAGSTSNTVSQHVNTVATSTMLTSSPNPSTFGQSVTFTATVTPASGTSTPTGTVNFLDGTATIGSGTLNASGVATLSTSALTVGTHSITAAYQGDPNFSPSTSAAVSQHVSTATTSAAIVSSANPSNFGQSVTFTATVTPASGTGTPTGTVRFLDGATMIGTSTLNGSGTASVSALSLAVGTHSITAAYQGDTNFSASTSPALTQTVNTVATSTALTSSANPSTAGQSVTFTATVTPNFGTGTPTGTVNFLDGATMIGSGTLSGSGIAKFTTSSLTAGTHSITAAYQGDANFNASTSAAVSQQVKALLVVTSTALTSSVNPSLAGQSVTFTATVTPASGTTSPTGTVNFLDGATMIGSGALNASGMTTFATSSLAVGTHSITASYGGDPNFTGSTSPTVVQHVNAVGTSTALASSANPSTIGQSVTFTATVTPAAGSGTPTGMVNFLDGATMIGSGTLNASGVASFTTSSLTIGTHSITAAYLGDPNFTASTSAVLPQQVTTVATTTTLASSVNPSAVGQSVTFTATVTSGSGTPSGTVTFLDGTTQLGTGNLNASGSATFTTNGLTQGTHSIKATYPGSATFAPSASAVLTQTVNLVPDFTLGVSPPTVRLSIGQSGSYVLTITPVDGFNKPVSIVCTGAPGTTTCAPAMPMLTLDGKTPANVMINVTTQVVTGRMMPPGGPRIYGTIPALAAVLVVLLSILSILGLSGANREIVRRRLASVGLLLVISFAATSCTGGMHAFSPTGDFVLTLTVSSTDTTHSTTVTLIIE